MRVGEPTVTAAVLGLVIWVRPAVAQGPPPGEPAPPAEDAAPAEPPPPAAPQPAASPSPTPPHVDPSTFPLRRAVEELGRIDGRVPLPRSSPCPPDRRDVPCFPVSIEVQGLTPQEKLQRFFEDFDALHGPAPGASAPTHNEVLRYSGAPPIGGVDLLGLARFLSQLGKKLGPPRYFVYVVRQGDKAWPELREGRVPAGVAHARPGVTYEEVAAFPDLSSAQAAYERLEDALAVSAGAASPARP